MFAYGQTGSGKTFTMEGPQEKKTEVNEGIIPRAVKQIFDHVETNRDPGVEITITCSFVEIYMERIRDLLDKSGKKDNLDIRVDLNRGVYVDQATVVEVHTDGEMLSILSKGSNRRHTSATGMNEESSRSHAIFMVTVVQKNLVDLTAKTGKLFLVDLAGSEMVSKTGATGQQLEEAKLINKSLSSLGLVIKALTEQTKQGTSFIPYRDSKLTRMLQDSLGGSSRACLIIACSPNGWNISETLSTLRFGTRAKFIKNKPKVHVGYGGTKLDELLQRKEATIESLRDEIAVLQAERARLAAVNAAYHDRYGDISGDSGPALSELVDSYEEHVARMKNELLAIEREAHCTRTAVAEVENHLLEERIVFGKLGSAIARFIDKFGASVQGLKEDGRHIADMLHLGRWRAEETLRKLSPLGRAVQAVFKAATAVRAGSLAQPLPSPQPAGGGVRKGGGGGGKAAVAVKAAPAAALPLQHGNPKPSKAASSPAVTSQVGAQPPGQIAKGPSRPTTATMSEEEQAKTAAALLAQAAQAQAASAGVPPGSSGGFGRRALLGKQ